MKPVICYVLCNPLQNQDVNFVKVLFLETVISTPKKSFNIISKVLKFIPFMQVFANFSVIGFIYINFLNKCYDE